MKEYKMTEEQRAKIFDASKPTPVMAISDPNGGLPIPIGGSSYENAMAAWRSLGEELGFDYNTVRPVPSKSDYYFMAEGSS